MASAIDFSKPEDSEPAIKADLRANLQAAKIELDHGGFAEGLVPANYGPPATSKVQDHLAAIDAALGGGTSSFAGLSDTPAGYGSEALKFVKVKADETGLEFAPAPGGSNGLTGWVDVKADHGAVGNGVADDTAEIQAALNSGASTVYFPVGTYKVTVKLTVTPGTRLLGAGPARSIIDGRTAAIEGGEGVLTCTGTETSLPSISASMVESGQSITFASSIDASLKLGDWIRIVDTTNFSIGPFSSGEKDGFYCMVCSAEGSSLFPYGGVRRTLPAPRTAGPVSNLQAFKLDQRGLWIGELEVWATGFDLDSTDNFNEFGSAVDVEHLANVFIGNSRFLGAANSGLHVELCANVHLNNSVFGNHAGQWNSAGSYGIHCRGTGHLYANHCFFLSQRHGFECDNHSMPSHDLDIQGGMVATPQEVEFQQPVTNFTSALNTHTGCYNIAFRGVRVYGGTDLRSPGTKLLNCVLHGHFQKDNGALRIFHLNTYDITIQGCELISYVQMGSKGAVITLEDTEAPDPGLNTFFIIKDNTIRQAASPTRPVIHLRGLSSGGADSGTVVIDGNVVLNAGSAGQDFIDIDMASGKQLVVRNNVLPAEMDLGSHTGFTNAVVGDNTVGGSLI